MNILSVVLSLILIVTYFIGACIIYREMKLRELREKISIYKKIGKEEKSFYFLEVWKEIEIHRIKALGKMVKTNSPNEASDAVGITSNDSIQNFMKAIEITSGKSQEELIQAIAKRMEQK